MDQTKKRVSNDYGINIIDIRSQKGGWTALAYKISDSKKNYFLKVYEKDRTSTAKWTALIDSYVPILMWLVENSALEGKISVPLLTKNGSYKCEDAHHIYLLYDYIDGETIGDQELSGGQIQQLAHIIAELHKYGEEIPVETDAIKEAFTVPFLEPLQEALNNGENTFPRDLWKLLYQYLHPLKTLLETISVLSHELKKSDLQLVLCHTDLHYWNVMQSNQLVLIDWEGLTLAPIEADLMFFIDKPYFDEFLAIYQTKHPNVSIHSDALQFYQGKRRLEDIWEFLEQLLYDEQMEHERIVTINDLKTELEAISK